MATINSFYRQHVMEFAVISEDGMVVTLPSEKDADVSYEVCCEQTEDGVAATSCQCRGFEHRGLCKHLAIVQEWYNAQALKITEIEKGRWFVVNSNTQVWLSEDGQWLSAGPTENALEIVKDHLEKQSAVKEAEEIVAQPVETEEVTEDDVFAVSPDDKADVAMGNRIAAKVAEAKQLITSGVVMNTTAAKFTSKPVDETPARSNDIGVLGALTRNRGFCLMR